MKIKTLLIISLFFLLFFSCQEYKNPLDNSIKPGYFYCQDGSIVYPKNLGNKIPIGVVFWVNSDENKAIDAKAYAVSLKDIKLVQWSERPIHIKECSTDIFKFNGFENTVAMISFDKSDTTKIHSSRLVWNYMTNMNWFIPSVAELKSLYFNNKIVNKSIELVNGEKLNNWYWTSTQDGISQDGSKYFAYIVSIKNGTIISTSKTNNYPIRPIIRIK